MCKEGHTHTHIYIYESLVSLLVDEIAFYKEHFIAPECYSQTHIDNNWTCMRLFLKDRHTNNAFPEFALRFENSRRLRSVLARFFRLAHGLVHFKINYFTSRDTKLIDFIEKNLKSFYFQQQKMRKRTLKCHKMKITYPI